MSNCVFVTVILKSWTKSELMPGELEMNCGDDVLLKLPERRGLV